MPKVNFNFARVITPQAAVLDEMSAVSTVMMYEVCTCRQGCRVNGFLGDSNSDSGIDSGLSHITNS